MQVTALIWPLEQRPVSYMVAYLNTAIRCMAASLRTLRFVSRSRSLTSVRAFWLITLKRFHQDVST